MPPIRTSTRFRAATTFAVLAAWVLSSFLYIASRSYTVDRVAWWFAERTAGFLPVREINQTNAVYGITWPPGFIYGSPRYYTLFRDDEIIGAAFLPLHAACCFISVWLVSRCGFRQRPDHSLNRQHLFWNVFWHSSWRGLIWLVLPFFVGAYWYCASHPQFALRGRPPTPMLSMIYLTELSVDIPTLGAFLGYLASVVHVTRSTVWKFASSPVDSSESWPKDCLHCGYQAAHDKPCPECGESQPLSTGAVYLGKWHARLARRRFVDPLRLLIGCIVAILFAWPLVAGVLFR